MRPGIHTRATDNSTGTSTRARLSAAPPLTPSPGFTMPIARWVVTNLRRVTAQPAAGSSVSNNGGGYTYYGGNGAEGGGVSWTFDLNGVAVLYRWGGGGGGARGGGGRGAGRLESREGARRLEREQESVRWESRNGSGCAAALWPSEQGRAAAAGDNALGLHGRIRV